MQKKKNITDEERQIKNQRLRFATGIAVIVLAAFSTGGIIMWFSSIGEIMCGEQSYIVTTIIYLIAGVLFTGMTFSIIYFSLKSKESFLYWFGEETNQKCCFCCKRKCCEEKREPVSHSAND